MKFLAIQESCPFLSLEDVDPCANHDCINDAICMANGLEYACLCQTGWTGLYCHLGK